MDVDNLIVPLGGVALAGFAILSNGGNMSALTGGGAGQQIKELQSQLALETIATESRQSFLEDRSQIALQRYQNGCRVHVRKAEVQRPEHTAAGGVTVEYLSVVQGDVARNPDTGGHYSRGVVLCDAWGNTGVVGADGAVEDAAHYGGNVHPFIQRHFDNQWGRG